MTSRALGLLRDVRAKGPREGLRYACHRINEAFHEWCWGIHTSGVISPAASGFTDADILEYAPTSYAYFIRLIRKIRSIGNGMFF